MGIPFPQSVDEVLRRYPKYTIALGAIQEAVEKDRPVLEVMAERYPSGLHLVPTILLREKTCTTAQARPIPGLHYDLLEEGKEATPPEPEQIKRVNEKSIEEVVDITASMLMWEAGFRQYLKEHARENDPAGQHVLFYRRLADLIQNALGVASLEACADMGYPPKPVLEGIVQKIKDGQAWSAALNEYKADLDEDFIDMVEASEPMGDVDSGLEVLAHEREKEYRNQVYSTEKGKVPIPAPGLSSP